MPTKRTSEWAGRFDHHDKLNTLCHKEHLLIYEVAKNRSYEKAILLDLLLEEGDSGEEVVDVVVLHPDGLHVHPPHLLHRLQVLVPVVQEGLRVPLHLQKLRARAAAGFIILKGQALRLFFIKLCTRVLYKALNNLFFPGRWWLQF